MLNCFLCYASHFGPSHLEICFPFVRGLTTESFLVAGGCLGAQTMDKCRTWAARAKRCHMPVISPCLVASQCSAASWHAGLSLWLSSKSCLGHRQRLWHPKHPAHQTSPPPTSVSKPEHHCDPMTAWQGVLSCELPTCEGPRHSPVRRG